MSPASPGPSTAGRDTATARTWAGCLLGRLCGAALAAVLSCTLGLSAAAGPSGPPSPVPGADEAAFRSARTALLSGDEEAALPVLASLAQGGNQAARILLALIDKSPELQGPWLSSRSRSERIALMRAPGGLSGTSWMRPAAEAGVPLAALWVELWSVEAVPDIVLRFAAAGEPRASREALIVLAKRQVPGRAALADAPDYPPLLRSLLWAEWAAAGGEARARVEAEAAALDPGDPQAIWAGVVPDPEALEAWLAGREEARPLAALCRSACPEAVGACTRAGLDALGGVTVLAVVGSPSAALIDPAEYDSSPMGQSALLRRIQLTAGSRGRASLVSRTREISSCLADRMVEEFNRY
jgi:hypothetical protein